MAKRVFDRELEVYLSARRKGKPFSFKEFFGKLMPKRDEIIEVTEDTLYPEVDKIPANEEKSKLPWLKKFFSNVKLPQKKAKEEPEIEYKLLAEDAVCDLKKVTKIALEAIKNLPPEKIKDFKDKEEFTSLKKILKKHELIK